MPGLLSSSYVLYLLVKVSHRPEIAAVHKTFIFPLLSQLLNPECALLLFPCVVCFQYGEQLRAMKTRQGVYFGLSIEKCYKLCIEQRLTRDGVFPEFAIDTDASIYTTQPQV